MSDPTPEKEAGSTTPEKETTEPESVAQPEEKRKREYKDFGHDEAEATRTSCKIFNLEIGYANVCAQMQRWTCLR